MIKSPLLITGISGMVGSHLALQLLSQYAVSGLSRGSRPPASLQNQPILWHVWQNPVENLPSANALQGIDTIVHLAGENVADRRWNATIKQKLIDSRVLVTRNLIRQMANSDTRPKTFIAASAIGYYGDRGEDELWEDAAKGSGFLADLAQAWEAESLQAEALGMRVVILRIGVVLSRSGGALKKMVPVFQGGLGGELGSGRQWLSWIHLEDLVALLKFVIEHPEVRGVYNAVAPNPVTNQQFTKVLGQMLHRPTLFNVPRWMLQIGLGEMSEMLLNSQRCKSTKIEKAGFNFAYPTLSTAFAAEFADKLETR